MPKSVRLNDAQLVLLSHAVQDDAGSLLPLPASLQQDEERARKEAKSLLRRKLIEEREVGRSTEAWRSNGDIAFGLFVTDKGRAAIGIDEEGSTAANNARRKASLAKQASADQGDTERSSKQAETAVCATPRPGSKLATVVDLLARTEGASLDEMVEATGWLPHTARAALTGLKKKGYRLASEKFYGMRRYRIEAERADGDTVAA